MVTDIINYLISDDGTKILMSVIGLVITFIQGTKWFQQLMASRNKVMLQEAYKLLETVVNAKYAKVRDMKANRPDGKLTDADILALEDEVKADLQDAGKKLGINALKTIGPHYLSVAITYVVRRLKGGSLPKGLESMFPQAPTDVAGVVGRVGVTEPELLEKL